MNKVRIIGLGVIFTGFLIGYFYGESEVFILSAMMVGVGAGWTITGRLKVKTKESRVRSE